MAKSVTNSGHCKALNRLENDRGEITTQKYTKTGQKMFNDESSVVSLDDKSDH